MESFIKIILIIPFFFFSLSLHAELKLIEFFPPINVPAGKDVQIKLKVSNPEIVSQIILSYRSGGMEYQPLVLSKSSGGYFTGFIPGRYVKVPSIEIFIYYVDVSGKSYFLFANEQRPFKITVAQKKKESELEEEFQLFRAEDVVVTAARHRQQATKAPAAITVLDQGLLNRMIVFSMGEALKYVPGMEVYEYNPGYYLIGARGMADESNNMSLFRLDGMELNNQMFDIAFSEIVPISMHDIARIEIIRGPGSALYGANAFSTVVNIISIDPEKNPGYYFSSFVGDYNTIFTSVGVNEKKSDTLSYSVSGVYRKSKAYDKNATGFESKLLRTVLKYKFFENSALKLSAGLIDADDELFSDMGEVPTHGRISYFHISYDYGGFRARVFWNNTYAKVNINEPAFQELLGNIYGSNNMGDGDFLYEYEFAKKDRIISGVNFRYTDFQSKVFEPEFSKEERAGVYLQNEFYPSDLIIFTLGARYDWNSVTKPGFSPKAALIITPINNNSFRLSVAQAFLKPAFYQSQMKLKKLVDIGIQFANPDLDNEMMTAYEVGYAAKYGKHIRFNIDLYYNQHRHAIQFSGVKLKFITTQTSMDFMGGEVSLRYIAKKLVTFINYSYLLAKNVDTKEIVLQNPRHTVNVGVMGDISRFRYAILAHYISHRYNELPNPLKGSLIVPYIENQELGNYVDLNVKLSYMVLKSLEVGIYGKNLAAPNHREFPGDDNVRITSTSLRETYGGDKLPTLVMGYIRGTF